MRRHAAWAVALTLAVTARARADAGAGAEDEERTALPGDEPGAFDSPDNLPLQARADNVSFDARQRELDLSGNVALDSPPFHLTSDRLHVRRTAIGVEVTGAGSVAFCPCLGTPLTIAFDDATVSPPGDLFLRSPRLKVFGLPVLWLPYFWLRSPGRPGLLPPDVAYRGQDGVFLGGGIHLPWRKDDVHEGLDVHAGAYLVGGAAVDARLRTEVSTTNVKWDHLRGDGLSIDARGAIADEAARSTVAWDADIVRGARGLRSTTDLDAAARTFDRANAEAAWRNGGWTLATGVRAVSVRGGGILDFGAAGPMVSARRSESIGSFGAYDATLEGGSLRGSTDAAQSSNVLAFARGEAGAFVATRLGPMGASLRARGAGDIADGAAGGSAFGPPAEAQRHGLDGVATARGELTLPFVRSYATADPNDPVRHRIEPRIAATLLTAHDEGVLGAFPGRGAAVTTGSAWILESTIYNALGRWAARDGSEIGISGGAVGDLHGTAHPVTRWRVASSSAWTAASAEAAHVFGSDGPEGVAGTARYRLGRTDSVHLGATVAFRDGIDPVLARALTDAPLEPGSGFLSREGWTGGARIAVPWSRAITTSFGADGDLSARELVAARAQIELRDHCDCLVIRGTGSQRIGRDGVDVWVTIDLSPR